MFVTSWKCKTVVHDLGQHYPVEITGPHKKCGALKCTAVN